MLFFASTEFHPYGAEDQDEEYYKPKELDQCSCGYYCEVFEQKFSPMLLVV
jgi:hypothetical protein